MLAKNVQTLLRAVPADADPHDYFSILYIWIYFVYHYIKIALTDCTINLQPVIALPAFQHGQTTEIVIKLRGERNGKEGKKA